VGILGIERKYTGFKGKKKGLGFGLITEESGETSTCGCPSNEHA
jgi:hypothetical protein